MLQQFRHAHALILGQRMGRRHERTQRPPLKRVHHQAWVGDWPIGNGNIHLIAGHHLMGFAGVVNAGFDLDKHIWVVLRDPLHHMVDKAIHKAIAHRHHHLPGLQITQPRQRITQLRIKPPLGQKAIYHQLPRLREHDMPPLTLQQRHPQRLLQRADLTAHH